MTQQEKDIKIKINSMLSELMQTDNVHKIKSEVFHKMEGVDISDFLNITNQTHYFHLMNIFNLILALEAKPVQYVKAALRDYIENDKPVWMDIVKRIAA